MVIELNSVLERPVPAFNLAPALVWGNPTEQDASVTALDDIAVAKVHS